MEAWKEFTRRNPDLIQLCNGMNAAPPEHLGNHVWHTLAAQPSIYGAFDTNMQTLVQFLRDTLQNDHISVKVDLAPQEESERRLTPKEFLEKISKVNHPLSRFLLDMDCEISQ